MGRRDTTRICPLRADTDTAAEESGQDSGAPSGSSERRLEPEPQPTAVKPLTGLQQQMVLAFPRVQVVQRKLEMQEK